MKKLSEMFVQNGWSFVRLDMVAFWCVEDGEYWPSIDLYDKNMDVIYSTWYCSDDNHSQSDLDEIIEALRENWNMIN